MVSRRTRESLMVQLLDTRRMLEKVQGHPVMAHSLKRKEADLMQELEQIPVDLEERKVVLLFHGGPVKGSMGIDAMFISKVAQPFQNMVTAEYGHRVDGKVGKRGQLNNRNESRLFLTALPRGSFGIELSKLESSNLFEDNQFSDALSHVAKLVESSARSDEDFAVELDGTTPRTIKSLQEFFKAIADDQAGVRIESGGIRCDLDVRDVQKAYTRVSETITEEKEITLRGVLKGMLLESWKFDFVAEDGTAITGRLDEDLTEEQVSEYITTYFNKPCQAILKEGSVLFKNGRERKTYVLMKIEA